MKKTLLLATFAIASLLAGCNDTAAPGATREAAQPGSVVPSEAAITAGAQGFTVGSVMAKRTVYVFFDAQCPHCAHLWEASKPLLNQARFVWIPVGFLSKASVSQGAALLGASDPLTTMNAHEASMAARTGGMSADSAMTEKFGEQVKRNTNLLVSFGVEGIPWTFTVNPATGQSVTINGSRPTADYALALGLTVPAGLAPTAAPVASSAPAGSSATK